MMAPSVWAELDFIAAPFCVVCGFPFDFEIEKGACCASCLESRPPFESARAAVKYNDASRRLVLGFKHGDQMHMARTFIPWLKAAGAQMLPEADYIMPVPLHRLRLFRRRYNQSAVIARDLARQSDISALLDALLRTRATPPQGRLSAKDRHKNVKSAFVVNPAHVAKIQGKTIVLIDDVYTTGATVKECTKALLGAGAHKVHVLCVARVVKSQHFDKL